MGTILLNDPIANNVEEIAKSLFPKLGISTWQRRESQNFPLGHYFSAELLGFSVKLYSLAEDCVGYPDFRFGLSLQPSYRLANAQIVADGLAELVAGTLASQKMDVATSVLDPTSNGLVVKRIKVE